MCIIVTFFNVKVKYLTLSKQLNWGLKLPIYIKKHTAGLSRCGMVSSLSGEQKTELLRPGERHLEIAGLGDSSFEIQDGLTGDVTLV